MNTWIFFDVKAKPKRKILCEETVGYDVSPESPDLSQSGDSKYRTSGMSGYPAGFPPDQAARIENEIAHLREQEILKVILPKPQSDLFMVGASIQQSEFVLNSLSTLANQGHSNACEALLGIASFAIEKLNEVSFGQRKLMAERHLKWPLVLSGIAKLRKAQLRDFDNLQLGSKIDVPINIDAVLTKKSRLKKVIMFLVAIIKGWQGLEGYLLHKTCLAASTIESIATRHPDKGFQQKCYNYMLADLKSTFHRMLNENYALVVDLGKMLNVDFPLDDNALDQCVDAARKLEGNLETPRGQEAWFEVAMSIVEALTKGEYHLNRHGLRQWGGERFISDEEDEKRRPELRSAIRWQIKSQFHRLAHRRKNEMPIKQ